MKRVAWLSAGLILLVLGAAIYPRGGQTKGGVVGEQNAVPPATTFRRVSAQASGSSISPDGRLISVAAWETGDLGVYDLESGDLRLLTGSPRSAGKISFAEHSAFSRDGEWVAYNWLQADSTWSLRVIPSDGSGEPRTLVTGPFIMPHDWSPDARFVAAQRFGPDRTGQIVLVSVEDGTVRALRSQLWETASHVTFSPDSRFLAYDLPGQGQPGRGILVMAVDASAEYEVVPPDADNRVIAWSPDGDRLVFSSDRSGTPSIWSIAVESGRAVGGPILLRADTWGIRRSLGATPDGRYFLAARVQETGVYVATVDPVTGSLSEPRAVHGSFPADARRQPAWSPDGSRLAFIARRGPRFVTDRSRNIVLVDPRSGQSRELVPDLSYVGRVFWSPDGSLVLEGADDVGRRGYYRVDAQTGGTEPVLLARTRGVALSPDGSTLYYRPRLSESLIVAYRIEGGTADTLEIPESAAGGRGLALGPHGERFAVVSEDGTGIALVSRTGGDARTIYSSPPGKTVGQVAWARDGQVLIATVGRQGQRLIRISLDTGGSVDLGVEMDVLGRVAVHPDGGQIAFAGGTIRSEVWVLETDMAGGEK